jgi:hypothetical protein
MQSTDFQGFFIPESPFLAAPATLDMAETTPSRHALLKIMKIQRNIKALKATRQAHKAGQVRCRGPAMKYWALDSSQDRHRKSPSSLLSALFVFMSTSVCLRRASPAGGRERRRARRRTCCPAGSAQPGRQRECARARPLPGASAPV